MNWIWDGGEGRIGGLEGCLPYCLLSVDDLLTNCR